jgi:hypothetical protein
VIIVLYRKSDDSFFWQEVPSGLAEGGRRLRFNKKRDVLDRNAVDHLAALTVPKAGFGYYVPPLGGGEDALVNILPINLPPEMFAASTPHTGNKATAILLDGDESELIGCLLRHFEQGRAAAEPSEAQRKAREWVPEAMLFPAIDPDAAGNSDAGEDEPGADDADGLDEDDADADDGDPLDDAA